MITYYLIIVYALSRILISTDSQRVILHLHLIFTRPVTEPSPANHLLNVNTVENGLASTSLDYSPHCRLRGTQLFLYLAATCLVGLCGWSLPQHRKHAHAQEATLSH